MNAATKIEEVSIWREFDAKRINAVLNHPEVRPWIADANGGVVDVSPQVAVESNVLLMGEFGGCLLFKLMPGVYEVHTQVLPDGRGVWSLGCVRACMNWMFTHTDAIEITTRVPQTHRAARGLAVNAGMKYEFTREDGCKINGEVVPVEIFCVRLPDWVARDDTLADVGHSFHDWMNEQVRAKGITTPPHLPDENHNRYVGAALSMALSGQVPKGVLFYNRWAVLSRHAPITLLTLSPPTIRFDVGLLTIENGELEFSLCA